MTQVTMVRYIDGEELVGGLDVDWTAYMEIAQQPEGLISAAQAAELAGHDLDYLIDAEFCGPDTTVFLLESLVR